MGHARRDLAKTLTADHPVDTGAVLYSLKQAGAAAQPAMFWLVQASRAHKGAFVLLKAVASESQQVLVNFADPHGYVRRGAVYDLAKWGREGVRYVRLALDDKDGMVRREAIRTLGKMGVRATVALPRIVRALRDSDEYTRSAAWYALEELAPRIMADDFVKKSKDVITLDLTPGAWQAELKQLVADERIGEAILDALAEVSDKTKEEIVAAMAAPARREEK